MLELCGVDVVSEGVSVPSPPEAPQAARKTLRLITKICDTDINITPK